MTQKETESLKNTKEINSETFAKTLNYENDIHFV